MNILESRGFGADIAFAQDIVFITANRDDVFTVVLDFDTTWSRRDGRCDSETVMGNCWLFDTLFS